MNITELIQQLEDLIKKHGNLEVIIYQYTGGDHEVFEAVSEYDEEPDAIIIYGSCGR